MNGQMGVGGGEDGRGRRAGEGWWEGGQMGGREVGGQKWAVGEWRGEEGVGVMDEGAASQTRARNHP